MTIVHTQNRQKLELAASRAYGILQAAAAGLVHFYVGVLYTKHRK